MTGVGADAEGMISQEYHQLLNDLSGHSIDGDAADTYRGGENNVDTDDEGDTSCESDVEQGAPKNSANSSELKLNMHNRQEPSILSGTPKAVQVPTAKKPKKKSKLGRKKNDNSAAGTPESYYEFSSRSQVVGVTCLEIVSCTDLPPLPNMTRTGFDMDPFVIISFGKKTFKTKSLRHTLNPVFDETLMFPVMSHERGFSISFTVLDKDKISLNDIVATTDFPVSKILDSSPIPDPHTLLYNLNSMENRVSPSTSSANPSEAQRETGNSSGLSESTANSATKAPLVSRPDTSSLLEKEAKSQVYDFKMVEYNIPLTLLNAKYKDKNFPVLKVRARFLPYGALRQQFWRGLIKLFDADESNSMNIIEIETMLDQLGANLSPKTVEGFFTRFGKTVEEDELTIDELVICLEEQIVKDTIREEKAAGTTGFNNGQPDDSSLLPIVVETDSLGSEPQASQTSSPAQSVSQKQPDTNDGEKYVIDVDGFPVQKKHAIQEQSQDPQALKVTTTSSSLSQGLSDNFDNEEDERLIRVTACPFCGQPRLDNKAEIDIVTHLATCASQEWSKDNTVPMSKFVSSNQASERWYTKMMFKVTYGNYKLGANSANILVQDRETGLIQEEKMNAYVRLGIRLLYKGLKNGSMESKRIRKVLKNASIKQGQKYDNPASAAAIPPFVAFYNLNIDEELLPLDQFKTFNEFFYRKLKPGARVCDAPEDERIAVSAADCRSTFFPTITMATNIWVKGKEFSIKHLFADAYPDMVDNFVNGSLAIFRLAPQDYHRFHVPVSGVLGEPKLIEGEYYTVNPMAIRSALDVYGENVRVLVPIQSDKFGLVMVVCIGAMMVGSTVITRKAGERVERMDELGYFQFGGSTVLVLFEQNRIKFDSDLVQNSQGALETLVKVGMSIGYAPGAKEFDRDYGSKTNQPLSPDQIEEMKKKSNVSANVEHSNAFVEGSF